MNIKAAQNLMSRESSEHRYCRAMTPRGVKKDCLMLSLDGSVAVLQRIDGKKDFASDLKFVEYR